MFNKIYNFLISTEYFNPFGLRPEEHDYKLYGIVGNDLILVMISKSETWVIQLLSRQNIIDDFQYVDHISFEHKPNKFQILNSANILINKNLIK